MTGKRAPAIHYITWKYLGELYLGVMNVKLAIVLEEEDPEVELEGKRRYVDNHCDLVIISWPILTPLKVQLPFRQVKLASKNLDSPEKDHPVKEIDFAISLQEEGVEQVLIQYRGGSA